MERFQKVGYQLMHRSGIPDGAYDASLKDPHKLQEWDRRARQSPCQQFPRA